MRRVGEMMTIDKYSNERREVWIDNPLLHLSHVNTDMMRKLIDIVVDLMTF